MTLKNPNFPPPAVGHYYEWKGPAKTFYMGRCAEVEGSKVRFEAGPWMLDDGRYCRTEPARALIIPVYRMDEGARA